MATPRDSVTATSISGIATTATGTLIQEIACQLMPWTAAPPTTGLRAIPSPEMPPQLPMAAERIRGGTAEASRVSDNGMIAAAPSPWTARATMSAADVVQSAAAIEAIVKRATPAIIIRRRPRRSPSVAAGSMKVAKTSV